MNASIFLKLIFLSFAVIITLSFATNNLGSGRKLFSRDRFPEYLVRGSKPLGPQSPIMSGGLPGSTDGASDLIVSDILNKERDINAFASLARQIEPVSTRLSNGSKNTTVLAPTNAVLQKLPRKPWESPQDYEAFGTDDAYAGVQGQERAAENLKRFVEVHVVPESPWDQGNEIETLGGVKVYWEKRNDGKIYIQPGDVEVNRVATQVSNGEVWIVNGVINY